MRKEEPSLLCLVLAFQSTSGSLTWAVVLLHDGHPVVPRMVEGLGGVQL